MTDDEYEQQAAKRTGPVMLGGAAIEVVDLVGEGSRMLEPGFWAAQEAKIAAAEKREAARLAVEHRAARVTLLREANFPLVPLEGAVAYDEGRPNAIDTPAMARTREFMEQRRISLELAGGVGLRSTLVLSGGTGAGKTAAACLFGLRARQVAPAFVRASELEARGRYDKQLRNWLRTRDALVLDDLGAEVLDRKGMFVSLLGEVFDMFHSDRKPMVITTNLRKSKAKDGDDPQLTERYGERIRSRLAEAGVFADCGAVDLRRGGRP